MDDFILQSDKQYQRLAKCINSKQKISKRINKYFDSSRNEKSEVDEKQLQEARLKKYDLSLQKAK